MRSDPAGRARSLRPHRAYPTRSLPGVLSGRVQHQEPLQLPCRNLRPSIIRRGRPVGNLSSSGALGASGTLGSRGARRGIQSSGCRWQWLIRRSRRLASIARLSVLDSPAQDTFVHLSLRPLHGWRRFGVSPRIKTPRTRASRAIRADPGRLRPSRSSEGGPFWIRTRDLSLIRTAL